MKPLAADITRCLGEGHAGRTCIMRQYCRRFLDRDRGTEQDVISYSMMLCDDGRYVYRIDIGSQK